MAEIELVDVSLRDGNQSLWGATGLRTDHILQIAPVLNRVGFRALDFMSSTAMGVAVRTHREDPWERIRLTRAAMPDTPLQLIGTGFRFISWERAHPEVMQLVYERLVAAGISRFVLLDPMHDMDAVRRQRADGQRAGGTETILALTYTISAVHDDDFYAGIAAAAAASPYIDRAYIKDPAGLLTPERARTLIPAVRARLGGKPLELHAHCTIGLSPLVYLVAPDLGVSACCRRVAARWPTGPRCPTRSGWWRTCARSGTPWTWTTGCWRVVVAVLRSAGRGRGAAVRPAAAVRRGVHPAPAGRRGADHAAAAAGRTGAGGPVRRGDRGGEPGQGRTRLPDHGHPVPADGDGAGAVQRAGF